MQLTGEQLIGARRQYGTAGILYATNPATGEVMQPAFGSGTVANVDAACTLAAAAFDTYRAASLEQRALFLEAIADGIVARRHAHRSCHGRIRSPMRPRGR